MLSLLLRQSKRRKLLALCLGIVLIAGSLQWRTALSQYRVHQAARLMDLGNQTEIQQALQLLRSAELLEERPSAALLFELGRAWRRGGDVEKGLEYLQRAEQSGYSTEEVRIQRQLAMIQRGHIDDSDAALRMLISRSSSDKTAFEVYEALSKGYLFSYRFQDAMQCLNFWLQWSPKNPDALIWRASIFKQTEKWEQAVDDYRQVLSNFPENVEARQSLASILLLQLNQTETAYKEFQECLKRAPSDVNSILGAASCERRLGHPEEAEQRLTQLLKLSTPVTETSGVKAELAEILIDRGETEKGVDLLKDVVHDDPRNSAAWYALGSGYVALGEQDRATECFKKSEELRKSFGRLTDITAALIGEPKNIELRWEAGKILMDNGMFTEGAAWMSTVLIYDPDHQSTHQALSEYYSTIKHDEPRAQYHRERAGNELKKKE
ncbi:MAG: tetratricopeptide repeat protein [Planctomyces sp.]|nr:tetratricopeptide repeat protein [Planctomyces sp.]